MWPYRKKYFLSSALLLPLLFAPSPLRAQADDSYPRITAMETTILGKKFEDSLPERLARLEIKAFGKSSDKAALSDRTDKLESYFEQTYHKQLFVPAAGYQGPDDQDSSDQTGSSGSATTSSAALGSVDMSSSYPRVTALEQAILGKTFEGEQLTERLTRMEVSAFTKDSSSQALGDRTDALEDYAEKKLHKKILGQTSTTKDNPESGASGGGGAGNGTSNASGGSGLLAKMGGALLGLPGGGGFFAPGFGPFAGVRVRQRSAGSPGDEQPSAPSHAPSTADEAIIEAQTPPPVSCRITTKVAWCEKRIFGQISQKHLPERLDQLNIALNFAPGKNSIDLMDDVDKLVKSAAQRPVTSAH